MSSPPRKMAKTDEAEVKIPPPDGIITLEVDKFSTLSGESRQSRAVEVQGVHWKVSVDRIRDSAECGKYLTATLTSLVKQVRPWEIKMDTEFTLIYSDSKKDVIVEESVSFGGFRLWRTAEWIVNEKAIIEDKVIIEVRCWITNMTGIWIVPRVDFTDPDEPRHDVALIIEGEKIYASKQMLAMVSPVFREMFCGDKKNEKEFELKGVDRVEFLEMLRAICHADYKSYEYSESLRQFDMGRIGYSYLFESEYFTNPNELCEHPSLMIGETLVYANKQILAVHSPVFNTMFYGPSAEKNEGVLELKDVDREQFIEVLSVLYPSCKQINKNSVEYLLKIGDRFQMKIVMNRAEDFLCSAGWIPRTKKLRFAEQYKMKVLEEKIFTSLTRPEQILVLEDQPSYQELSDEMRAKLERKFREINIYVIPCDRLAKIPMQHWDRLYR